MEPIIITPKNEQEYSFIMELLGKLKISAKPLAEKPLRRMTVSEYRQEAIQALEDVHAGRVISQDEMEKRVASWR